jgi:glycosyltransferase involved in cell wall biosynthesis
MGGPDMNLRLELMQCLQSDFEMMVAGTVGEHQQKFAMAGFKYYPYPLGRTVSPVLDLYSIVCIWRLCRWLRPHIVHTFDAKPGVWGRLAARWAGIPVVVGTIPGLGSLYANDDFSTRLTRAIYQPLQRIVSHVSDLTTFQNLDDARRFIAAGIVAEPKTMIIPGSGVPTDVYTPDRVSESERVNLMNELGIQSDEIVVTMVSRVIRTKGVIEFMNAATEIHRHCPKVHFLLIGPDDQASLHRLTADELALLRQTVTWPGPRRDIPTTLAVSDIFVFPSSFPEGIPRVLLEAASMGLPLITTFSPGCKEVVEDQVNGLLVPVHDAMALGHAILRLVNQPELRKRFGRLSRQRAVERFDLSLIAEQTRRMYKQLLARRGVLQASVS